MHVNAAPITLIFSTSPFFLATVNVRIQNHFFCNGHIMLAKQVLIKGKNIVLCFYFEGTLGSDCSKLGIKVADSTSGSGSQGETIDQSNHLFLLFFLTNILSLELNLKVVS